MMALTFVPISAVLLVAPCFTGGGAAAAVTLLASTFAAESCWRGGEGTEGGKKSITL